MTVEISAEEWHFIQDELRELARLRKSDAEYARRDAEYLQWSLGGGMAKAVLAGIEMQGQP